MGEFRHGRFLYMTNDISIGLSLMETGEYGPGEVNVFQQLLRPGDCVVDVGANIGALTVPIAKMVGPSGYVVAFEPQTPIYRMLCGTMALNELWHVQPVHAAAGTEDGFTRMPLVNYEETRNFGGVNAHASPTFYLNREERLGEQVRVITIDSLELPALRLLKCDAEGMEADVLLGATNTIKKFRPALWLENEVMGPVSERLIGIALDFGYQLYWSRTVMRYAGEWCFSINMLGFPSESKATCSLPSVTGVSDDWPDRTCRTRPSTKE